MKMVNSSHNKEKSKPQKNIPFIEIYDDGTVEKKITID